MPMTGWICVHTISQYFDAFERMIPWIALILLSYIGGKMLLEDCATVDKAAKLEGRNLVVTLAQKRDN